MVSWLDKKVWMSTLGMGGDRGTMKAKAAGWIQRDYGQGELPLSPVTSAIADSYAGQSYSFLLGDFEVVATLSYLDPR